MPSLFYSGLLAAAEVALNAVVDQDHQLQSRLAPLRDRVFEVSLTTPPLRCFLVVAAESPRIRLTQVWGAPSDVRLEGHGLALMGLLGPDAAGALRDGRVKVTGDMELARQLQHALTASGIDWEYHLSRLVGDVPARMAGEFGRQAGSTLRSSGENLRQDIDEYLHEEGRSLPSRQEVEAFYDDIRDLQLRCDRLNARLARLQR